MQNLYRRYAYCDDITVNGISIQQSRRDAEFERWLQLIGTDVKPHLTLGRMATSVGKVPYAAHPLYGFFRFECRLRVRHNGQTVAVSHTPVMYAYSEMAGTFRRSAATDVMVRTEFKSTRQASVRPSSPQLTAGGRQTARPGAARPGAAHPGANRPETVKPGADKPGRTAGRKVSLGKLSAPASAPRPAEPTVREVPAVKQMQGVEVDESF